MKKLWVIVHSLIFLSLASPALAEYRAYQYYVKSKLEYPYDSASYVATSSLDPVSFLAYHGGRDSIQIELLNSWMCMGHTGGKETCLSPYEASAGASQ